MRLSASALHQRYDRAVLAALVAVGVECTRSQLVRWFAAGLVTARGKALRPGACVRGATDVEVVAVDPPPLRAVAQDLPLAVVFEDPHILVVNKPAGMVVHPGPGHAHGTLVNAVLHYLGAAERLPVLPGNPLHRPGIVHRIDRDTSGLLVIARTTAAQEGLARQFRDHSIERSYLGFVRGTPNWEQREVETGHARDPSDRRRFTPDESQARRAVTHIEVVRRYSAATKLRFRLYTGRTHQIRMHARHLGYPLIADTLYARAAPGGRISRLAADLGRHALHAEVLGFRHPKSGLELRFESSLPPDLQRLASGLASHAEVDRGGAGA